MWIGKPILNYYKMGVDTSKYKKYCLYVPMHPLIKVLYLNYFILPVLIKLTSLTYYIMKIYFKCIHHQVQPNDVECLWGKFFSVKDSLEVEYDDRGAQ